jgi:putative nucleotidyltransferase with HDIG domain
MILRWWRESHAGAERRPVVRKVSLVVAMSALITLMVSPNLNLVSLRYEVGDIISQDVVISDNVAAVDPKSTEARRAEALANFPPIYDHDTRLKSKIFERIRTIFGQARATMAQIAKNKAESQTRIRSNSLEQIRALSARVKAQSYLEQLRDEKELRVNTIGGLSDLQQQQQPLNSAQALELEKLRFDLMAVNAHVRLAEQNVEQINARLEQLEARGAELIAEANRLQGEDEARVRNIRSDLENSSRITLEDATFQVLLQARFNPDLEQKAILLLDPVLERKIVASLEGFDPSGKAIQIQGLDSSTLTRFEALETITDVAQVRASLDKRAQELNLFGDDNIQRQAIVDLAKRLVQPNLTENKGETERQKQELARSINPVFFNLKKGEIVARAGERATEQQVEVIRALNAYNLQNPKYPQLIGTFLIILIGLGVFYQLVGFTAGVELRSFSRLLLMSILLLLPLLFGELVLLIVPGWTLTFSLFPPQTYNYLIPAALASMLGGILLRFEVGVFLGFSVALCMSILLDNSLSFFIFSLMGSFVAALPMRAIVNRYALWRQGLRISAINVPVILVLALVEQRPIGTELAMNLGAGLVNGFVVAFLASTILPFLESAFDITTNIRLLELSNMNHPALKELSVRAPGTYHHSIVVGNLAESAAEGIQANALLVRVASYYHDLGKMLCPLYFVENQNNRNYHDDLPARTSAQIIISHVKNGLEIARRHRLGTAICDILEQHHGNSLVRFFFHKAQQEQAEPDTPLEEGDFRYPGPKPQTKESGLVMLADITESATRSLEDPSEETIRKMVQKQATRVYSEGQLDESSMTFNDLNFIEKTFTKILLSIHHHRIPYPELRRVTREDLAMDEPDATPPADQDFLDKRSAAL